MNDVHPLAPFGWSDRVDALVGPFVDAGAEPARVVGIERGRARVAASGGERFVEAPGAVVGDWLALDGDAVREVLPRWSTLARLGPEGERQLLAANVDLVLVAAPADRLSAARVERELVVAWDSGARPVVLLTKLDLAAPGAREVLAARLGLVDIIATSAIDGAGLDELRALLVPPVTAVLLGPSGAGKSTLVNALLGEERLGVADVRADDRRGRHTTTTRTLLPLPSGGSLVDMPGLRSLGTDADADSIAATFPEIEALAARCRFADCAHEVEPGCAVTAAVAAGELDPDRLASFRKLMSEAAFERRRTDPVAREENARIWKRRTKEMRRRYRDQDRSGPDRDR